MKYNLLKSTPEEGYESWFTASWDHPSQTVKADRGGGGKPSKDICFPLVIPSPANTDIVSDIWKYIQTYILTIYSDILSNNLSGILFWSPFWHLFCFSI